MKKGLSMLAVAVLASSISILCVASNPSDSNDACFSCHQATDPSIGDNDAYYIQPDAFHASVHASQSCTTCHSAVNSRHPETMPNQSKQAILANCLLCHETGDKLHRKAIESKNGDCTACHGRHNIRPFASQNEACLTCHQNNLTKRLKDGSILEVTVHPRDIQSSAHREMACADCHLNYSTTAHPSQPFESKRAFTLFMSQTCKRCHFDKFAQTLEATHFNIAEANDEMAPVCTDCHGAHSIQSGRTEKLVSARRCQTCHDEIYTTYTQSVHGAALLTDHNQDVPICSDCHTAHNIQHPQGSDFRNRVPEMCGNCHANEELMKKYGLTTAVLDSYLDDFHGVTSSFYKNQKGESRRIAVCTDCHGVHNISKTDTPNATILKNNLAANCQRCHVDAPDNFPDAWLSHYAPTWQRAPIVYIVHLFYKIFIPFMIIGLILQVLLHLWRYAVNR